MTELGISQTRLGELVADLLHEAPVKQAGVYKWLRDPSILTPPRVFAIEQALQLTPGQLSRSLGYLPVDAVAHQGVVAAIEADPQLSDFARYSLTKTYEAMVEMLNEQRGKSRKRPRTNDGPARRR